MFLKTTLTIFSALVISCGTTEKQTQVASTEEIIKIEETIDPLIMKAEGYLLGTIIYSDKESDCPYTIQMPGNKMEFYYLDPMNLEENFKVDGQKVWVKFNGLRRMNRCDNAVPAEIVDMKKGE